MTRSQVRALEKALDAAQRKSAKLAEARRALPAGSPRSRVTSADARWSRAAEERDRLERELAKARAIWGGGCRVTTILNWLTALAALVLFLLELGLMAGWLWGQR